MTKTSIVSSSHLSENASQLSEFEYALTMVHNAFSRWLIHCMAAAGNKELSPIDILILHNVHHRQRPKRIADICFVLNMDDTHTVSYSLRKLAKLGLIESQKVGKETFYASSESGAGLCLSYRDIRQDCLLDSLSTLGVNREELGHMAKLLRTMSGVYDQSARVAASF